MSKMKNIITIAVYTMIIIGCSSQGSSSNKSQTETDQQDDRSPIMQTINGDNLFTLTDAENILGEKAQITDRSMSPGEGVAVYKSTYTANNIDKKTGKTGNIYFMIEHFAQDSTAKSIYAGIKQANENHGIKVLDDLGDEAYFHSDNQNFYFILVRKGTKMFRMKVNKITGNTSLDQFNSVAKNITAKI
jgi:hypothetical protein